MRKGKERELLRHRLLIEDHEGYYRSVVRPHFTRAYDALSRDRVVIAKSHTTSNDINVVDFIINYEKIPEGILADTKIPCPSFDELQALAPTWEEYCKNRGKIQKRPFNTKHPGIIEDYHKYMDWQLYKNQLAANSELAKKERNRKYYAGFYHKDETENPFHNLTPSRKFNMYGVEQIGKASPLSSTYVMPSFVSQNLYSSDEADILVLDSNNTSLVGAYMSDVCSLQIQEDALSNWRSLPTPSWVLNYAPEANAGQAYTSVYSMLQKKLQYPLLRSRYNECLVHCDTQSVKGFETPYPLNCGHLPRAARLIHDLRQYNIQTKGNIRDIKLYILDKEYGHIYYIPVEILEEMTTFNDDSQTFEITPAAELIVETINNLILFNRNEEDINLGNNCRGLAKYSQTEMDAVLYKCHDAAMAKSESSVAPKLSQCQVAQAQYDEKMTVSANPS